jgi:hypothetical protein
MQVPTPEVNQIPVPPRKGSHPFAIISLLGANLLPIAGHYFWGWDPSSILFSYWMENVVIIIFNTLKISKAEAKDTPTSMEISIKGVSVDPSTLPPKKYAQISLLYFGGFTLGHGLFTVALFGMPTSFLNVATMFAVFLISHWISYQNNYIQNNEYKRTTPGKLMFAPISRVIISHIAILGCGFLFIATDIPLATSGLIILVGLKTIVDLSSHLFSHWQKNMGGEQKIQRMNSALEEMKAVEKLQNLQSFAQNNVMNLFNIKKPDSQIGTTLQDGSPAIPRPTQLQRMGSSLRRSIPIIIVFVIIALILAFTDFSIF